MREDYQRPASRLGPLFWLVLMILTAGLIALGVSIAHAQTPVLPQAQVDTSFSLPPNLVQVPVGTSLQTAINNASFGTTLVLPAGATFSPVVLPARSGTGWIYIVSSSALPGGALGLEHNRVTPANAAANQLAKIQGALVAAVTTAPGAHHYRFVGVEFASTNTSTNQTNFGLIQLGADDTSAPPHHIIIDRCYIHGTPTGNLRRGVNLAGTTLAVIDSSIMDVHEVGADSQAIAGWNGMGPFKIANNELQGAGENVMFGGANPAAKTTIPSDIEILGNHFFKPLAWQTANWSVKNLLELKNAQRLRIEGNIFENNWLSSQNGLSITFTPRGEGGTAAGIVADVTFRSNIGLNLAQGFNLSGKDDSGPSDGGRRVLITNNSIAVNKALGGDGRIFQPTHAMADLQITQNTLTTVGKVGALSFADQAGEKSGATGFVFTGNLASAGEYGFLGSGNTEGTNTLNGQFAPGWTFTGNVIYGSANPSAYPPGNQTPATLPNPPPAGVGVDQVVLAAATACTLSGQCAGVVPPPGPDTTPPTVTITSPTTGQSFQLGTPIPLVATATDNQPGVSPVSWAANGQPVVSPYTPSSAGAVTLVATARDAAGNVGASSVSLTITSGPPQPPTPIPCAQGAWVLASLTQSGAGFTATFTRPTLTAPQNGGAGCGPSQQTFTVVIGG